MNLIKVKILNQTVIKVSSKAERPISVKVKEESTSPQIKIVKPISVSVGGYSVVPLTEYDNYEGVYIITPNSTTSYTLDTDNKLCTKDIIINKIPYYETSNDYGTTCIIGES